MYYIFIINPLGDRLDALPGIQFQAEREGIEHEIYRTEGEGDATRYVNLICDLYPEREICFVACGGSGTIAEIISGLIGRKDKFLAVFPCGNGKNHLLKSLPARNFKNVHKMVAGETYPIDAIKVNDNYAVSFVRMGRKSAFLHEVLKEPGNPSYLSTLFWNSLYKMSITIDGVEIRNDHIQMINVVGGKYCGKEENLPDDVLINDGKLDVCTRTLSDIQHHRFREYVKASHIELQSKSLIYASLDGEMVAATNFVVDVLPSAIQLILPSE